MDRHKSELLAEINQIIEQYRREVPGRRCQWSESLKSRVLALREEGWSSKKISEHTKIPYFTVLRWVHEKKEATFGQVKVVAQRDLAQGSQNRAGTVTESTVDTKVATVTVPTLQSVSNAVLILGGSGIRVEGVTPEFLISLLPKLGVVIR